MAYSTTGNHQHGLKSFHPACAFYTHFLYYCQVNILSYSNKTTPWNFGYRNWGSYHHDFIKRLWQGVSIKCIYWSSFENYSKFGFIAVRINTTYTVYIFKVCCSINRGNLLLLYNIDAYICLLIKCMPARCVCWRWLWNICFRLCF